MKKSKIPREVMLYRCELARDLLSFSKLLERHNIDSGEILRAVTQLKDEGNVPKISPSHPIDYNIYGYNVNNIKFTFNETPCHTHPVDLENITLTFDISLRAKHQKRYSHSDPLKYLEFNLVVIGFKSGKEHIISYHLDRHPEGDRASVEAHPKYHFQFGGRKLNKNNRDFGQSIILDSPRVMHYPMDIILGVDFIISNFFPKIWNELKKENDYVSLVTSYRDKLMKPFFCSLANHWTGMLNGNSDWNTHEICPQLF